MSLIRCMRRRTAELWPPDTTPLEEQLRVIRTARFADGVRCPHCEADDVVRWGHFSARQRYRCKACGRTFSDLTGMPAAYSKKLSLWPAYAGCMADGLSVRKSAMRIGVTPSTAFRWRHAVLDGVRERSTVMLHGWVEVAWAGMAYSIKGQRAAPIAAPVESGQAAAATDDETGDAMPVGSDDHSAESRQSATANGHAAADVWPGASDNHSIEPGKIGTASANGTADAEADDSDNESAEWEQAEAARGDAANDAMFGDSDDNSDDAAKTGTADVVDRLTNSKSAIANGRSAALTRAAHRDRWIHGYHWRYQGRRVSVIFACDRHGDVISSVCDRRTPSAKHVQQALTGRLAGMTTLLARHGSYGPVARAARKLEAGFRDTRPETLSSRTDPVIHDRTAHAYRVRFFDWMTRFCGVATKYLPNYLVWHDHVDRAFRNGPSRSLFRWPDPSAHSSSPPTPAEESIDDLLSGQALTAIAN